MRHASHRYRSLGELTDTELEAMLHENETLFVEHKRSLGPGKSNYQLAKAVASFANGLGGWVLIGVDPDGSLNHGKEGGFASSGGLALIDRIRQALENEGIDPMPAIAAGVRSVRDNQEVGVLRIYESSDTPHILRDGTIYIREPAKDSRNRWLPSGVDSHHRVMDLATRGARGRAEAEARLEPLALPFTDVFTVGSYEFDARGTLQPSAHEAAVTVRLTPIGELNRFREWAVSHDAVETVHRIASQLVGLETPAGSSHPHANGTAARALEREMRPLFGDIPGLHSVARLGAGCIDGGGVISATLGFRGPDRQAWTNLENLVRLTVAPPLHVAARELERAEFFGRFLCHAWIIRLADVAWIQDGTAVQSQPEIAPAATPMTGELTIPALLDDAPGPDLESLAARWGGAYARACGVSVYE